MVCLINYGKAVGGSISTNSTEAVHAHEHGSHDGCVRPKFTQACSSYGWKKLWESRLSKTPMLVWNREYLTRIRYEGMSVTSLDMLKYSEYDTS